jgi:5-methylcytosine-specific restriction protein B
MSKLFLGKISSRFPQQFEENFYAAGKKGNSFYGGIEPGDYVFPSYDSSVSKLWRVKRYNPLPHELNPEGTVEFEVVRLFDEVPISVGFARYRHFVLNINLLNKLTKSTGKEGIGFYEIRREPGCPPPEGIDLLDKRNIYIALPQVSKAPVYKDGDIRVTLNNNVEMKIVSIDIYSAGEFRPYDPLVTLYNARNVENQRYSLTELYEYTITDQAEKKKEYLKSVIEEIKRVGFFTVGSPIGLYDNVLVGRKRTKSKKRGGEDDIEEEIEVEEKESIEQIELDYKEYVDILEANPNLILFGPPGTGKTYAAQKIIEAFDYKRTKNEKAFKQIEKEGRVDFVTFHQSFSYEEFVEGLRPVIKTESSEDAEGGSELQYKIQDGILKQIANRADLSQIKSEFKGDGLEKVKEDNTIWKISLGRAGADEDVYQNCIISSKIAIGFIKSDLIGWAYDEIFEELKKEKQWKSDNPKNDARSIDYFLNVMQTGDVILVFATVNSIRAIGVVTGEYEFDKKPDSYRHKRAVKWLKEFKDEPVNILKYNNNVRLTLPTLYPLNRFKFSDIKEILEIGKGGPKVEKTSELPYYLIIDEINRGNISKIFGELITLVEKDKRNRLTCKLPYSQKPFSLPANLYIIGTMNTADRSIAVLDVALRRRFYFKEIEPDVKVIRKNNESDLLEELVTVFTKLNELITKKLDRDHRIGHSSFLNIKSITDFRMIWYYQIIPLLMEYFYNDAASISEIIGTAFIDKSIGKINWIQVDDDFMNAIRAIK